MSKSATVGTGGQFFALLLLVVVLAPPASTAKMIEDVVATAKKMATRSGRGLRGRCCFSMMAFSLSWSRALLSELKMFGFCFARLSLPRCFFRVFFFLCFAKSSNYKLLLYVLL